MMMYSLLYNNTIIKMISITLYVSFTVVLKCWEEVIFI